MPNLVDITGHRYGRLTVLSRSPESGRVHWKCRCDCGTELSVQSADLRTGNTQSCSCLKFERIREASTTHGHTAGGWTTTFRAWSDMKTRCYNPKNKRFAGYAGRGITVCDRWRNSFENFLADMGEKPLGLSLDRINNDGNYEPDNCRWATYSQQNKNRRSWDRKAAFAKGRDKHHRPS